jgi:hypothetical protein
MESGLAVWGIATGVDICSKHINLISHLPMGQPWPPIVPSKAARVYRNAFLGTSDEHLQRCAARTALFWFASSSALTRPNRSRGLCLQQRRRHAIHMVGFGRAPRILPLSRTPHENTILVNNLKCLPLWAFQFLPSRRHYSRKNPPLKYEGVLNYMKKFRKFWCEFEWC